MRTGSLPWLERHRPRVAGLIVVAALIIRTIYFFQLNASGLIEMQRWDQTDMHYYDGWARTIAGGDWLSATVVPPMHQWQRDVAEQYFERHREALSDVSRAAQTSGTSDRDLVIWKRWMHTPQFYQDPLYGYFIAAMYRVVSDDPRSVIVAQLLSGVCTVLLLWRLTLHYFGDAAAVCAAALSLLCAPIVFYEGLLLRDSLVTLAGLVLVWLTERVLANDSGESRPTIAGAAGLGFASGMAWLLKSTFVALWLVVLAGVLFRYRRRLPRLRLVTSAILAGFTVAAAPLALRNAAVGVAPLTLAPLGAFTLISSNIAGANPDAGWEVDAPVLASFFGETDGSMRSAFRKALETHSPASYAKLLWRKWDRTWHWFDIPSNENRYYVQRQVPVLRWLRVTFWPVAPLALVGVVLAARRFDRVWPLVMLVAFSAASLVGFLVLARYRVPLLAAAIPFAALTMVEIGRLVVTHRYARAGVVLGGAIALAAWTGRPRSADEVDIRTADWLLPFSMEGQHAAEASAASEDWTRAAAAYTEFFRRNGPAAAAVAAAEDPTLASTLARMHAIDACFIARAGDDPTAEIAEGQMLLDLAETRVAGAGPLQPVLRADIEQAASGLTSARRDFAAMLNRHGVAAANAGRMTDAVADFRRVVVVDPGNSHAHLNLARALAAVGVLDEAMVEARSAAALAPADDAVRLLIDQLENGRGGRRARK